MTKDLVVMSVIATIVEDPDTTPMRLLSRPICDTILKRLEGPTKDRTAY